MSERRYAESQSEQEYQAAMAARHEQRRWDAALASLTGTRAHILGQFLGPKRMAIIALWDADALLVAFARDPEAKK